MRRSSVHKVGCHGGQHVDKVIIVVERRRAHQSDTDGLGRLSGFDIDVVIYFQVVRDEADGANNGRTNSDRGQLLDHLRNVGTEPRRTGAAGALIRETFNRGEPTASATRSQLIRSLSSYGSFHWRMDVGKEWAVKMMMASSGSKRIPSSSPLSSFGTAGLPLDAVYERWLGQRGDAPPIRL